MRKLITLILLLLVSNITFSFAREYGYFSQELFYQDIFYQDINEDLEVKETRLKYKTDLLRQMDESQFYDHAIDRYIDYAKNPEQHYINHHYRNFLEKADVAFAATNLMKAVDCGFTHDLIPLDNVERYPYIQEDMLGRIYKKYIVNTSSGVGFRFGEGSFECTGGSGTGVGVLLLFENNNAIFNRTFNLLENIDTNGIDLQDYENNVENTMPYHANNLIIEDNGNIIIESSSYGENDPNCCPSLNYRHTFELKNNRLVLIKWEKF